MGWAGTSEVDLLLGMENWNTLASGISEPVVTRDAINQSHAHRSNTTLLNEHLYSY